MLHLRLFELLAVLDGNAVNKGRIKLNGACQAT